MILNNNKYEIVRQFSKEGLEAEVNKRINEGWEPIGGVSNQDSRYMQAMVKKEEVKRKRK
jgi:hypothetical protein